MVLLFLKRKKKQTNNRLKMESLVLSPMSANQDLIANLTAVPAFPRNVTFNQPI